MLTNATPSKTRCVVRWVFMKIPSIQTDTTAQGLMTTKELAVYLRVTTRTIANLLKRRKIPVIRVGSINRYQVDKVVEALTEGQ